MIMRKADLGQRNQRLQCLACENNGCIGHCRFAKAIPERARIDQRGVSDQATALPRLYRSPLESFHWFVWTNDGWFRFPAKIDGWADRCATTNLSHLRFTACPNR